MRVLAAFTAENARRHVIAIAMGKAGAASRIIFPGLGSLLTYAHLGRATAPGQMDLKTTVSLLKKQCGKK